MLKDEALARWRGERHPQQKALHEQRHEGEKQCLGWGKDKQFLKEKLGRRGG